MNGEQSQDERLSNALLAGLIIIIWAQIAKEGLSSYVSEKFNLLSVWLSYLMDWLHEILLSNPVEAYVEEIQCIFLPRNKSIYIPHAQRLNVAQQ